MPGADFRYIDTAAALEDFLTALGKPEWLALDTEFVRERSYYPKLCLIQLATPDLRACIDPLALPSLEPLFTLLNDTAVTKVLHSAHQDLEIIYLLSGTVPEPIFDTQIVAAVLGIGDQVGYGRLVQQELGVSLNKSHARTDWARRPLSPAQLSYAIDDVRYLCQLYPRLLKRVLTQGREQWLRNSFKRLTQKTLYDINPNRQWLRVRGSNRLRGSQLPVIQDLAAWRERKAIEKNIPRRWVIPDDLLLDLARRQPSSVEEIESIRAVNAEHRAYYQDWIKCIEVAVNKPQEAWPSLPTIHKLTANQEVILDALMTLVRMKAQEQKISPSVLANRKMIESMLKKKRMELDYEWRGELLNDLFKAVLEGKAGIFVRDGQVVVE